MGHDIVYGIPLRPIRIAIGSLISIREVGLLFMTTSLLSDSMAIHPIEYRYGHDEMKAVWNEETRL